ncbi:MAG: sugar O-acetyltransferase [Vibrio sp.]
MSELEKMLQGVEFDGNSQELIDLRRSVLTLKLAINQCLDDIQRRVWQEQLFGHFGTGSIVQIPFHCEFGQTIHIGNNSFLNMNVTMLDGAKITIGDHVLVGPNTQFYTATHSFDYRSRRNWEATCRPIVVEDDVWIGGNVVITQGVTIGARSVIAANSVVTKDVPPDALYGGTPARCIRELSEGQSV